MISDNASTSSIIIFIVTILLTFVASYLGRRHESVRVKGGLSGHRLNKWLVGLSAGAAANSGFIVTGAVGLGYSFGAQWLLLPLAWLLGDIVFWTMFPDKINRVARETKAATMSDIITSGMDERAARTTKRIVAIVALLCLGGYVSAQWIAGEKFLAGAFGFSGIASLLSFAALIVLYTSIGGFRGSVYADSMQAVIRIVGTTIALAAVIWVATGQDGDFRNTLDAAGPNFLSIMPNGPLTALLFILGYVAAALGFGLGQPQIVTRYMAGSSPEETKAAWWVYIGFVQFTWIAMTIFGIVLRGVMPDISDPETGLSAFFRSNTGPFLTGIIAADIFATIAATSNSLLVVMAQTARHDLLLHGGDAGDERNLWPLTVLIGGLTMIVAFGLNGSVVEIALSSVALMGAGLAPAFAAKILGWKRNDFSVILSIFVGIIVAVSWKLCGYSGTVNEAFPGILSGLAAGWLGNAIMGTGIKNKV